jgi:hypothetical protein
VSTPSSIFGEAFMAAIGEAVREEIQAAGVEKLWKRATLSSSN